MAGGGGSNKIEETSQQRAQAQVAQKQWQLYQDRLKPQENIFLHKVDELNDPRQYERAAAVSNLGYESQFGQARQQRADNMLSHGFNPADPKFERQISDLATEQEAGQLDGASRYQVNQADRYVAGLQDVAALGAGQKADALRGYSSLADMSLRRAQADAQISQARRDNFSTLAGAAAGVAGAGALAYSHRAPGGATNFSAIQNAPSLSGLSGIQHAGSSFSLGSGSWRNNV